MLKSYEPSGSTFEFDGKTYTVESNLLCGNNIKAVRRYMKTERRRSLQEALNLVRGDTEATRAIIQEMIRNAEPQIDEMIFAMSEDPEIAAILLNRSCPELATDLDEAKRVANEYPNYLSLVRALIQASGINDLKNSIRHLTPELQLDAGGEESAAV